MAHFQTKCPCGETVEARLAKPKAFTKSVAKVACECGSRFLAHAEIVRGVRSKAGTPLMRTEFEVIELSHEATAKMKSLAFRLQKPIRALQSLCVERDAEPKFE